MSLLKKIAVYLLLFLLCTALLLITAGGGFGDKEDQGVELPANGSMLFFGHRGLINYYPENSMEGFSAAQQKGLRAIEADVSKTSDGEYIIFHDDNASRLLGINKPINELTLNELKAKKIIFNGTAGSSEVITLDELLGAHGDDLIIYLDMKISSLEDADNIAGLVKKHKLSKSIIIADGNLLFLSYLEYFYPELITALEGAQKEEERTWKLIPKNFRPDYLSGFAKYVDADHITWLKKNKLLDKRIVYGVTKENAKEMIDHGLRHLVIDYDSTLSINYTYP